jgi:hypothetical protein
MGYPLRQSLGLFPRCSDAWIGIPEPSQSSVKKFICGRSAPGRALSIEGPAKNELRRTILFSSHWLRRMAAERYRSAEKLYELSVPKLDSSVRIA